MFPELLLPATKLGQGNILRSVCQQFCPQEGGGGMHGCTRGACVVALGRVHGFIWKGGMRGFIWGACMVLFGGHAWFYLGGHAWFYSGGGLRGFFRYNEIRSISGQYASYWNAFLFYFKNIIWTCHLRCKRRRCYHSTSKAQVAEMIFKLIPIHALVKLYDSLKSLNSLKFWSI